MAISLGVYPIFRHTHMFLYIVVVIKVEGRVKSNTHIRIHGAAIYGNMDPINIPPLC